MADALADEVANLLREVGDTLILPRYGALEESDIDTKSGPTDLVTIADKEAELWLTPRLRALVDCPVIGEEACATAPEILKAVCDARAWTVDPVDGTSNFVQGNDRFCSMIALLERGVPVASWIWMPLTGELFYAAKGEGARLVTAKSRQALGVDQGAGDLQAMRGGGNALGMSEPRRTKVRTELRSLPGRRFPGSSGVLGAEIARGDSHFLFHGKCTAWDHAPVDLLCREAGAFAAMIADEQPFTADRTEPFLVTPTRRDWHDFRDTVWKLPSD